MTARETRAPGGDWPPPDIVGLTAADVERETLAGRVNTQPDRTSRSYAGIVRHNVLTRFNAIITALAVVVLVFGHPIDAIFAGVMVVNTAIGIIQEVRAKRTLDRLRLLVAPTATAHRGGRWVVVAPEQLVVGDVLALTAGDQVPVDAIVLAVTGLEVDESALTGEADPVTKRTGDEVRSGSLVIAGRGAVRATRVGEETWIHQLVVEAKEFVLASSELRRGVDRILQLVGWSIAPLAGLLVWSQLRDDGSVAEGLVSAVAGVVGLVPQGLVLLVSMALAVAVIRLARHHVVVQELHAVEGLARVDVLCLDKTGTLTTGAMHLDRIELLDSATHDEVTSALAALAAAEPTPTSTLTAAGRGIAPDWRLISQTPFSSARKWSGATFDPGGTWIVGAPEIVLDGRHPMAPPIREMVAASTADARRVLLVARSRFVLEDHELPADVSPVALVVLAEELRPDAAATMRYFAQQQVEIKIVSGDNPVTVATVAQRLGIEGADRHVDLRSIDLDGDAQRVAELVRATTVFGRVQPHQKRQLVDVLQGLGHTVAMTGDGVNDIPALKRADIGIAMDTATSATKAVSQLVLVDGRFDHLPAVVAEGRRVITNMERVSALFLTKTVYAAIFALVIGVWGAAYPFLPRHLSLVSELTIGVPAFALSFRSADRPYRPGFLARVMRFAAPAGTTAAVVTLTGYWIVRSPAAQATLEEARTAATLTLLVVASWILYLLMQPIDRFDAIVLGGLAAVLAVILASELGRTFYAIDWPPPATTALVGAHAAASVAVTSLGLRAWRRRGTGDDPAVQGAPTANSARRS